MRQPEALRLAAQLEDTESARLHLLFYAAAELRRLHAENEALREANEAFGKRQEWWNEKMFALEQQRDALLEALKEIVAAADGKGWEQLDPSFKKARAAIAKAEGEES